MAGPINLTADERILVTNSPKRISVSSYRRASALICGFKCMAAINSQISHGTDFEKINVLPNFLIHMTPENWLHCAVLNEQRYFWSIAINYDVG